MSQLRFNTLVLRLVALGLAAGLNLAAPAIAAEPAKADKAENKDVLSPGVFKALQGLQELINAKKFAEAYAKVDAADAQPNKTDYEKFIIERNRGAIATLAGDTAIATKSITYVIETKRLSPEDQQRFIMGIAGTYYNAKDYPNAIKWIQRYQAEGGKDATMNTLLAQAYFLSNDFPNAYKLLSADLANGEKTGNIGPEIQYQLLLTTAVKMNDKEATHRALEKMVTYYPTRDAWNDYLQRERAKPGYPESNLLDFYRLKLAIGIELEDDEIRDMADLDMRAGLPAEAKKVLDKGYQAGLLGKGKEAKNDKQMQDKANRGAAEDIKTMASGEPVAQKSKDGLPLVNLGLAYVTNGQFDKGIPMMEEGVKRGVAKRPTDAKLRLGYAYYVAGRTDDALKTFQSLSNDKDATGDLARYWIRFMSKPVKK
jgi:hypothetical protein